MKAKYFNAVLGGLFLLATVSQAQWSYPGCADVDADDFRVTTLFNNEAGELNEPVKMAFDMDAEGNVFIYFVQLRDEARLELTDAKVNLYNPITDEVSVIGVFKNISAQRNEGLSGIALDPNFKTNGWMYFQYSIESNLQKLVRITLKDGNLDFSTEKILLTYGINANKTHTGGAMEFDAYGDFWMTTGDNDAGRNNETGSGPANTNDLRGKILRLSLIPFPDSETPEEGPGRTYNIPEGNLFDEAEDADDKTRPEIYAMGMRNPYTMNLHPTKRWVMVGDIGPDDGDITEEHLLITEPSNQGWPFFAGDNIPQVKQGDAGSAAAPINDRAGNTGLVNLPPAIPATYSFRQACAISGPLYRYNPDNPNPNKMPPHFDYHWFVLDRYGDRKTSQAFKINPDGSLNGDIMPVDRVIMDIPFNKPLDYKEGPDGAFYVINYAGDYNSTENTAILKVDYIGPECEAVEGHVYEQLVNTSSPGEAVPEFNLNGSLLDIQFTGKTTVTVYTLGGKIVKQHSLQGNTLLDWGPDLQNGIYLIKATNKDFSKSFRGLRF